MPLPWPKKEPTYIKKKIIDDVIILKWIPNIDPSIKKTIINNVFPRPIPKYEPTYAIYVAENIIEIFVADELSINLALNK